MEIPLFEIGESNPNVELLCKYLRGLDWQTASEILSAWGQLVTDHNRRWLRALAAKSGGRVAGGQRGYKLTKEMTNEEFNHWRNWMTSQADEMRRRVIEADRIWYARKPI